MTKGPQLRTGKTMLPGVLAVVLFAMIALIVINTSFGAPAGFDTDAGITSNIGYAMFDMTALQEIDSEPFLVSFILAAIVLDAALDASLVLAKREEGGETVTALSSADAPDSTPSSESGPGVGNTPTATDGGVSQSVDDDRGGET